MKKIISLIMIISILSLNIANANNNNNNNNDFAILMYNKMLRTISKFDNSIDKLAQKNSKQDMIKLIVNIEQRVTILAKKNLIECKKYNNNINGVGDFYNNMNALKNKSCYNYRQFDLINQYLIEKKDNINYEINISINFEKKADGIVLSTKHKPNKFDNSRNNYDYDSEVTYNFNKLDNKLSPDKDSLCTLYLGGDIANAKEILKVESPAEESNNRYSIENGMEPYFTPLVPNNDLNYLIEKYVLETPINGNFEKMEKYITYSALGIYSRDTSDRATTLKLLDDYTIADEKVNEFGNNEGKYSETKYLDMYENLKKESEVAENKMLSYEYLHTEYAENIYRDKILKKYNLQILSKARVITNMPIFFEIVKWKKLEDEPSDATFDKYNYGVLKCIDPMG